MAVKGPTIHPVVALPPFCSPFPHSQSISSASTQSMPHGLQLTSRASSCPSLSPPALTHRSQLPGTLGMKIQARCLESPRACLQPTSHHSGLCSESSSNTGHLLVPYLLGLWAFAQPVMLFPPPPLPLAELILTHLPDFSRKPSFPLPVYVLSRPTYASSQTSLDSYF